MRANGEAKTADPVDLLQPRPSFASDMVRRVALRPVADSLVSVMPVRRNARFQRYIKALPQKMRDRIKAAIKEGADEIVEAQKQLCPVRTGKLRDSIKATPGNENLPAYAALRSKRPTDRQDPELCEIITAGNRGVRYAHLVEFGTAPHINQGEFKGSQNPGAHAEPFFYPGYRARKADAQKKVKQAVVKAVRETWQGS